MKIGFFDSGIWWLTVLKEAIRILPNEDYIYFADSKNAPYWSKSKEEVKELILDWVDFLANNWIKALVVACNTATIVAVDDLRAKYNFPIVWMEPAVKLAVEKTRKQNKKILVLATCLTLQEERFLNLVDRHNDWEIIDLLSTQELVNFAENRQFDDNIIIPYIKQKLLPYNLWEYETIVLGCTHFPLFYNTFKKILPAHISIVDWSLWTVNRLKYLLEQNNLISNKKQSWNISFLISWEEVNDKQIIDSYLELIR